MIVYAIELRLFVGWRIESISYENAYYKILLIVLFHLFCSSLQYRSALVATRMRNIVYSTFERITSGEVPIRVTAE